MTVSITAVVGSNHKRWTFAQRERWVPDHDDGSTFTPGHWEQVGEVMTLESGQAFSQALTDEEGQSIKIWSEAPRDVSPPD